MEKIQDGHAGGGIYRPVKRPFLQEASMFLYNKDTGAFLGRTPLSWAKIILFYLIFYTCLGFFFLVLMLGAVYTLDPYTPKYQLSESLIGTSPGLGYRPMPSDENSLSTLIYYKGTQEADYKYWTTTLENFLQEYKRPGEAAGRGEHIVRCSYDQPPPETKICEMDIRSWYPCNFENNFGYHLQSPCIFLKLNKIFGWKPEFYQPNELPADMPEELKSHIKMVSREHNATLASNRELQTIWVHCEGETPADVENLGPVRYIPRRGFPYYYFPYKNIKGYLSPLVAINLESPRKGILINIECRAWAKNVVYDRKERLGSVHFEIMID